jgi:hypothetical protein
MPTIYIIYGGRSGERKHRGYLMAAVRAEKQFVT